MDDSNRKELLKKVENKLKEIEKILKKRKDKDKTSKERDKRALEETAFKSYENLCENLGNNCNKGDKKRGWQTYA